MVASGSRAPVASVMRRIANRPTGSSAGNGGLLSGGHHATTGVSGSRRGTTTLLSWSASSPWEPQHADLAGVGVAADPELGVESRVGGRVAAA